MFDVTIKTYIGMGTNAGARMRHIRKALGLLNERGIRLLKRSSIYQTSPLGPRQRDFYNLVLCASTSLSPLKLLQALKEIEKECGRKKRKKWGPREMDLDILYYGSRKFKYKSLRIPHPRIQERNFVIIPLKEIAPRLKIVKLTDPSQKVKLIKRA